jgi:hypothetical protein
MAVDGPDVSLFDRSAEAPRRSRSRGRWLARLSTVLALGSMAWFVWQLNQQVEAEEYALIETDRLRLDTGPGWVDPRWEEELAWLVAGLRDVPADDRAAVRAVADEVEALSFVRFVAEPVVLWPDGLRLEVELREPVACLRVGRQYVTLAADGTVLSGRWSAPPDRGSGYLPVLVPRRPVRPLAGEAPTDRALRDGLAVAASLWTELTPADLSRLGRIVIDARRSRESTVEEPGTVLLLENARTVWFGRSPNLDEPGETPVRLKWASLSRALQLLDEWPASGGESVDWELADVRWDRPSLLPRGGEAYETGM